MPRCDGCKAAKNRAYHREFKRREQRRAWIAQGLIEGGTATETCVWCEQPFTFVFLGRPRRKCDDCKRRSGTALSIEWARTHPERRRAIRQRYNESAHGTAATHAYNITFGRYLKYGLTRDRYAAMLAEQNNRCAICRTDEPGGRHNSWHVDHDRSCCAASRSCGKCVRGLLCDRCNKGLGLFVDQPERLVAAAEYIRRHLDRATGPPELTD